MIDESDLLDCIDLDEPASFPWWKVLLLMWMLG